MRPVSHDPSYNRLPQPLTPEGRDDKRSRSFPRELSEELDKSPSMGSKDDVEKKAGPDPGIDGFIEVLRGQPFLSVFIISIPLGFISFYSGWEQHLVFTFNFFAILPMAWLIGKSTEDLSSYTGEAAGGLLNATFGNVVEMLLCINGIRHNQIAVVQCTLVGSILSNLLLVMGTSFMWGGYKHPPTQKYSKIGAGAQSSLLLLAVICTLLPTTYSQLVRGEQAILEISRGCSILLLLIYLQYLFFQLGTHKEVFESPKGDDDEEDEQPDMDWHTSTGVLAVCTVLTAFCTEYLISSIEGTIVKWHVSKEFIGIVVLPIIGNAAEHYTAIVVAGQNKMDLSLGVAVGSSCQMALLVTPFTVLVGWVLDREMDLNFHPFQVTVLLLSVLIVANVLKDGESNWLEGSMLVTAYVAIAMIYYFEAGPNIATTYES